MSSCGLNKRNMERTDKEIIEAMTFIKEQHNGELPYKFGTFECAKMMAQYLKQQLLIQRVSQQRELLEAYTKQVKEDNELTEEITFQDINKCLASNCG